MDDYAGIRFNPNSRNVEVSRAMFIEREYPAWERLYRRLMGRLFGRTFTPRGVMHDVGPKHRLVLDAEGYVIGVE